MDLLDLVGSAKNAMADAHDPMHHRHSDVHHVDHLGRHPRERQVLVL
jgi:hypothetical protein